MTRCPITRARCVSRLQRLPHLAQVEPGAHLCDHHEPRHDRHGRQLSRCHTSDGERVERTRGPWGVEERRVRL